MRRRPGHSGSCSSRPGRWMPPVGAMSIPGRTRVATGSRRSCAIRASTGMKLSIATVRSAAISPKSSTRSPRPASKAWRSSRTICCRSTARPPMYAAASPISVLNHHLSSLSGTSRACRETPRERNFARAERKFDLMADSAATCCWSAPTCRQRVSAASAAPPPIFMRSASARRATASASVSRRSPGVGTYHDYRDAWEAVRRADHPAIGLVLDSFHIFARKTDLTPIRSIPRERIFLVQLADAPMLDMDSLSWSRHFRNFPGQGDLPLVDFMEALQATEFDGLLSLEIFNDQFRAGSASSVAVDGDVRCCSCSTSSCRPDPAAIGSDRKCLGTEFIEFAIDESGAPAFEALLREPRLCAFWCAQVQGGDALFPGRHQHRGQRRQGWLRPFLQHHPRHRRCAIGFGSKMPSRRSIAPSGCCDSRSVRRSALANSKSPPCAALAAASSISSTQDRALAGCGTSSSPRPAKMRPRRRRPHGG